MKLVFITNFINHHQVHVADEFYRILGAGYKFIETEPIPESFVRNGYPVYERVYVLKAYESPEQLALAYKLAEESDVVIIGSASEDFVARRISLGKLTFRYSERWFKSRPWFLTGLVGWINIYKRHVRYRNKPLYMLCASAYTAKDANIVGAYKNKCFKWGYFTQVDIPEVEMMMQGGSTSKITQHIMWCARFLRLKHPELPVRLAARLKAKGYKFVIDMFGSGEELENTKQLARKLKVDDVVRFCGNRPNDEILAEMRRHDIFLFTSDKNEGWGAVLNEAMSNGCAVVGSNKIGSVPFLIEDGVNGLIFKSENLDSLEEKVIYLISHSDKRRQMAVEACQVMRNIWSPGNAARQFIDLVEGLTKNDESLIPTFGPGSRV
jgi:glycosyltransferase involved in cell wall biosynthesis